MENKVETHKYELNNAVIMIAVGIRNKNSSRANCSHGEANNNNSNHTVTTTASTSIDNDWRSTMMYLYSWFYYRERERKTKSTSIRHAHTCSMRIWFPIDPYWHLLDKFSTINTDVFVVPIKCDFFPYIWCQWTVVNCIHLWMTSNVSNLNVFSIRHHHCFTSSNGSMGAAWWKIERSKIG